MAETRVCIRDDGARFPYSPQLARRKDFRILDTRTNQVVDVFGSPVQAQVLNFTPVDQSAMEYYGAYDEIQLAAALDVHGVKAPEGLTRDQLLRMLSVFPLPEPTKPEDVQLPPPNPSVTLDLNGHPKGTAESATQPNLQGLEELNKDQLIEKAKVEFGYEMPAQLNKQQMIEQFKLLKPAS